MGAWSHEPFGNDTACDWAYGLTEEADLSYVESALDAVLDADPEDYLESPEAEEAIAAVEVLAKMRGMGTQADAYTEAVDTWVAASAAKPDAALLAKAQRVLDRIQGPDSELVELWGDSEDDEAWKESMSALRAAVS